MVMNKNSTIFIAGHNGMVGRAIYSLLVKEDYKNIITADRSKLDLLNQRDVNNFFKKHSFDYVFICAAKVGGILANSTYPADFIYQNLQIELNLINSSHLNNVENILFLGSSCIYPKFSKQPILEDELLRGQLEETNEWYAISKIAGIKLCESYNIQHNRDYRSIMPTNLYGKNDNFHPENSHVIPALIRRFFEAKLANDKEIIIWGSGNPKREFLHVEDMALASLFVANLSKKDYQNATKKNLSHINIGTGNDISIKELAFTLKEISGFKGRIIFDESKPDGTPRKVLDIKKISSLGWSPTINLKEGLIDTYTWFSNSFPNVSSR
jgi:GDP-L-fucose synthase